MAHSDAWIYTHTHFLQNPPLWVSKRWAALTAMKVCSSRKTFYQMFLKQVYTWFCPNSEEFLVEMLLRIFSWLLNCPPLTDLISQIKALHPVRVQVPCVPFSRCEEWGHSCRLYLCIILLPNFPPITTSFVVCQNKPGLPGHRDVYCYHR